MMSEKHTVNLEFECIDFPDADRLAYAALRLGIQKGKEVEQDVPCQQGHVRFTFHLDTTVKADHSVALGGPYAQGPSRSRFVYLCWGERVNGEWRQSSRIKVALDALSSAIIERSVGTQSPVRARIRVTNGKGEPAAASLKPGNIEWL